MFSNFGGQGGALFLGTGFTSIRNSTLERNNAQTSGGAIIVGTLFGNPATAQLVNSTVTGNSAKEFGGAINVSNGASLELLSSTIVGNTANSDNTVSGCAGGIHNNASTVTIANTILAGNLVGAGASCADAQCRGGFTSSGHNLRTAVDANCTGFTATGDVVNANPLLGELGSNGGPTQTIPLLSGSPAIDAGDPSVPVNTGFPRCPQTDQRGLPRGGDAGTCDIGAFEVQPTPPGQQNPPTSPADAAAPDTAITGGPKSKTRKRSAKFEFTSTEPGSTFACSLDGGPFESCASPDELKVKKGKHHFEVRATDAAGNADATPATLDWKVKKKHK
jgi:predicted outer membrane repeat protein